MILRIIKNIRFVLRDKLIRFSVSWLLALFLTSLMVSANLQFKLSVWPYFPFPSEAMITGILSISYSFIVSYIFFMLTTIAPRIITMLNWYGFVTIRFHKFYEAWATIYTIYHFYFKIGNSIVCEDLLVQSKAQETNLYHLYYNSNRYEVALNLRNALYQLDVFATIAMNKQDTLPSRLSILLQETTCNPVKMTLQTIIEILENDKFDERNTYSYIQNDVKNLDIQFANLSKLSELLGVKDTFNKYISKSPIFEETANAIFWIK